MKRSRRIGRETEQGKIPPSIGLGRRVAAAPGGIEAAASLAAAGACAGVARGGVGCTRSSLGGSSCSDTRKRQIGTAAWAARPKRPQGRRIAAATAGADGLGAQVGTAQACVESGALRTESGAVPIRSRWRTCPVERNAAGAGAVGSLAVARLRPGVAVSAGFFALRTTTGAGPSLGSGRTFPRRPGVGFPDDARTHEMDGRWKPSTAVAVFSASSA